MKFVIFGLTRSSSGGNGHATLWRGLLRALIQQGHRGVFFERDVPYCAAHPDVPALPGGELQFFSDGNDVVEKAPQQLADADVGKVTSYCRDGVAAAELILDSRARLRVSSDLHTPVTLETLHSGKAVNYIGPRRLADFDLVANYTGDRALEELKTQFGDQEASEHRADIAARLGLLSREEQPEDLGSFAIRGPARKRECRVEASTDRVSCPAAARAAKWSRGYRAFLRGPAPRLHSTAASRDTAVPTFSLENGRRSLAGEAIKELGLTASPYLGSGARTATSVRAGF